MLQRTPIHTRPRSTPVVRLDARRMLVVEDDEDLPVFLTRIARAIDPRLEVDWATDAGMARDYLSKRTYQLVLVDYLLDGLRSGPSLFPYCRKTQPGAVFAMMSAYPLQDVVRLPGVRPFPFLRKPFTAGECRAFLEELLSQRGD